MADFGATVARLRAWIQMDRAAYERAAVELLIWQGGWLHRTDFAEACLRSYPDEGVMAIRWREAREFADRVEAGGLGAPRASSSEAAILDLAVALGEDRFRIGNFGHTHRHAAAPAFWTACGQGEAGRDVAATEASDNRS